MDEDKKKIIKITSLAVAILLLTILILYFIISREDVIAPVLPVPEQEEELEPDIEKPEDIVFNNFEETIAQLNTSQALVEFLNNNFQFEPREGNIALTPQEFFEKRKGGEQDFAAFTAYVLYRHGYGASILRYKFTAAEKSGIGTVVVFRKVADPTDPSRYMVFSLAGVEIFPAGISFNDLCTLKEERLNIKITEYAAFSAGVIDFSQPEWFQHE